MSAKIIVRGDNMKKNIWIDCDPGIDDSMAIFLALAHQDKLNILGLSTIAGNQTIEKVTRNALATLETAEYFDIPVAMGESKPLERVLEIADDVHGESGLGGPVLSTPVQKPVEEHAVDYMYKVIMAQKEKTTLIPIGPLTNIAKLLMKYPDIKEKIEMISFMGGSICGGNMSAVAEFNIYNDPEAAQYVMNCGLKLVMSGLEVADKAAIPHFNFPKLKGRGKVSQFIFEMLDFYKQFGVASGETKTSIYDACAIAYVMNPEMFHGEMLPVQVETQSNFCDGQTIVDRRNHNKHLKNNNVFVLLSVDSQEFEDILYDAFDKLDKRISK